MPKDSTYKQIRLNIALMFWYMRKLRRAMGVRHD